MISEHDKANIDRILGGYGDWFTAHLLRLIMKADVENRARLRLGFPDEVLAYENYVKNAGDDYNVGE